jgi:hypothetical protein
MFKDNFRHNNNKDIRHSFKVTLKKSGKKGDTKLMHEIIGIILAVIIFFILLSILLKLMSSYTGNHNQKSFDGFIQKITQVLQNQDNVYIDKKYILNLNDEDGDPYIIAWDYGYVPTTIFPQFAGMPSKSDFCISDYYLPSECEGIGGINQACICFYKKKPECAEKDRDKYLVKCHTFPGEVYFLSFYKDSNFKFNQLVKKDKTENDKVIRETLEKKRIWDDRMSYFGLTGDLNFWKELGVIPLYIEKTKIDNKNFILILPIDQNSNDDIKKRELLVKQVLDVKKEDLLEKINEHYESDDLVELYLVCTEYKEVYPSASVPQKCLKSLRCKTTTNSCDFETEKNLNDCICIVDSDSTEAEIHKSDKKDKTDNIDETDEIDETDNVDGADKSGIQLCDVSLSPFCTKSGCVKVHPNSGELICDSLP